MLVILDFDGTLADSWPWLAEALVAGAVRLGYRPVTRAEVEAVRRLDSRRMFEALEIPLDRLPVIAADLRDKAEAEAARFRLFQGVPDLIRTLRHRQATLAVVTSSTETVVRSALGAELASLVSFYKCGVDVFGKAALFKQVQRQAGVSASDTVAVGDETRDLEAARSAGIRGLAVEWGYADADLLRSLAPGRTAATVEQLLGMIVEHGDA